MGNISFVKDPSDTAAPPVVETPTAVAPAASVPSTSLATVPLNGAVTAAAGFFDDRNINFKDIIVPRLNVVQKVGDLSELFTPGQIVFNQTTVIHEPKDATKKVDPAIPTDGPLVITPIGCRPLQYAEKIEGGGRGLFFNSEAEVAAANGTIDYKEWEASLATPNPKKRFEEYATFLFLVKQPKVLLPDPDHQLFTHEINGEFYLLALMGVKGTWYTGFAKRLFTERKIGFLARTGYASFNWNLTTFVKPFPNKKGGTNYAIAPVLTNGTKNTPELLAYVKGDLGFGS